VELAVWAYSVGFPVSQQGHGEEYKGHLVEQVVRRDVAEVYKDVCVHGVREDKMVGEEEAEGCCEIEKAVGLQIFCVLLWRGGGKRNAMAELTSSPP